MPHISFRQCWYHLTCRFQCKQHCLNSWLIYPVRHLYCCLRQMYHYWLPGASQRRLDFKPSERYGIRNRYRYLRDRHFTDLAEPVVVLVFNCTIALLEGCCSDIRQSDVSSVRAWAWISLKILCPLWSLLCVIMGYDRIQVFANSETF